MRRKIVLGLLAVLIAASTWIALLPRPEERLAELVAELRARGEAVSLAERELPMPPDEQNGAHDLDAALAWFEAHEPEDEWESRIAGPWNPELHSPYEENATPEQMEALREFLVFLGPLFEHVDRGAAKPEIAWPLGPRNSAAALTVAGACIKPQTVLTLHKFLCTRATSAATADERVAAMRSLLAIGARLRAREPLDHLMAANLHAGGSRQLRAGLEGERVDPAAARARLDGALSAQWDARFQDVVRGARASWIEEVPFWLDGTMQKCLGMPAPTLLKRLERAAERLGPGSDHRHVPDDAGEMIDGIHGLGRYLDHPRSAREVWAEGDDSSIDPNPITMLLPRIRLKLVATDVLARLGRVALAAYEHRRRHGSWPESAADLSVLFPDGVPADPFTGAPFVIEHDADDLVLRAQPWEGELEDGEDPRDYGYVWRLPPR